MAKDLTPDAWIPSWAEDGTTISFPIASITGLTATEADIATGDIRTVLIKTLDKLIAVHTALVEADKPDTLTITKTVTATTIDYRVRVTGSIGAFSPGTEP